MWLTVAALVLITYDKLINFVILFTESVKSASVTSLEAFDKSLQHELQLKRSEDGQRNGRTGHLTIKQEYNVIMITMKSLNLTETKSFLIMLKIFHLWTIFIGLLLIFLVVPVYLILSYSGSSIVTYQYAYVISMAYLHGIPAVIFLGSLVMILCLIITIAARYIKLLISPIVGASMSPSKDHQSERKESYQFFLLKKYSLMISLHIFNLAVTILVNSYYVNSILADPSINRLKLLFLQVCLGSFKLLWNKLYIPLACARLKSYMSHIRSMENRSVLGYRDRDRDRDS